MSSTENKSYKDLVEKAFSQSHLSKKTGIFRFWAWLKRGELEAALTDIIGQISQNSENKLSPDLSDTKVYNATQVKLIEMELNKILNHIWASYPLTASVNHGGLVQIFRKDQKILLS